MDEKIFKDYHKMLEWIEVNKHKYRMDVCFIQDGYMVEYKKLKVV